MASVTLRNVNSLPDGEHLAADNLYLVVRGSSRSFVFRYVAPSGVRRKLSLGSTKKIGLTDARAEADRCRVILAKGIDPKDVRDAERERLRAAAKPDPKQVTVGEFLPRALEEFISVRCVRGSSAQCYRKTVKNILLPLFSSMKVRDLTTKIVAETLKPLWAKNPVSAPTARFLLENVLEFAVRDEIIVSNPAVWRGGVSLYLPSPTKFHRPTHRFAVSIEELREAMPTLCSGVHTGGTAAAIIALTACRSSEIARAKWEDFDEDLRTLNVPPERRKDGRNEAHRVPLSEQVRSILLPLRKSEGIAFPGYIRNRMISAPTILAAIREATGQDAATAHGLRSVFSQWAAENGVDFEVRETCLMHAVGNAVTRAYQRSDLLDRRREVMQAWADEILPMDVLEEALAERS